MATSTSRTDIPIPAANPSVMDAHPILCHPAQLNQADGRENQQSDGGRHPACQLPGQLHKVIGLLQGEAVRPVRLRGSVPLRKGDLLYLILQ